MTTTPNPVYGLPPRRKRLIDRSGIAGEPAVVYPASEVGSWWPVPTWNLRTPSRQSLQAASVKLPGRVIGVRRCGDDPVCHDGRSISKQGSGWERFLWKRRSGGNRERGALDLLVRSRCRPAVVLLIAQRRVADARELVGERTGRLVVIGARLHARAPSGAARRPLGPLGRAWWLRAAPSARRG